MYLDNNLSVGRMLTLIDDLVQIIDLLSALQKVKPNPVVSATMTCACHPEVPVMYLYAK
jgi:hypothetical protein